MIKCIRTARNVHRGPLTQRPVLQLSRTQAAYSRVNVHEIHRSCKAGFIHSLVSITGLWCQFAQMGCCLLIFSIDGDRRSCQLRKLSCVSQFAQINRECRKPSYWQMNCLNGASCYEFIVSELWAYRKKILSAFSTSDYIQTICFSLCKFQISIT